MEIYKGDSLLYSSAWEEDNVIWDDQQGVLAISLNKVVYGDLTFACYELLEEGQKKVRRPLFRYWVHTAFLPKNTDSDSDTVALLTSYHQQCICTVLSSKIDMQYPSLSDEIQIQYKMKKSDQLNMAYQDVSFFLTGLDARICGLHDIVNHHSVIVNVRTFQKVNSRMYDESVVKLALQLSVNDADKATALLRSDTLDPKKDFVYIRQSIAFAINFMNRPSFGLGGSCRTKCQIRRRSWCIITIQSVYVFPSQ